MPVRENIYEERNRGRYYQHLQELYRMRATDQLEFLVPDLQAASVPLMCPNTSYPTLIPLKTPNSYVSLPFLFESRTVFPGDVE